MTDWKEKIASLATEIDAAIEVRNIESLTSHCGEIRMLISSEGNTPESVKSVLTYYLANIYQELGAQSSDRWNNTDYGNAIICHRKFYRYEKRAEQLLPQVIVNHANTLETLCRTFEAIPLWKKGIMHHGDAEEVGLFRLVTGLLWLSNHLYYEEHTHYYQLYAYNYAKKLISRESISHDGIRRSLLKGSNSTIDRFLRHVKDTLDSAPDLFHHSYTPKYSKEEKKYRSWCKDNILFINPLNDLENAFVVDHDVLKFPSYRAPVFEGPYLSASFSSMKNEYCYCRHLFYEGINKKYTKFTDKDKYLTDTLDGVVYEAYIEKIKSSLKGCFGVLDKVSRLLDRYYGLNSSDIAFNRQWFDRQNMLKDQNNPFLTALFWLSKDFSRHDEDQRRPSYWLEDSAFEVRELRNELEHGWVRVIDPESDSVPPWKKEHDYAYTITSTDLIDKGLYVLKQTRNALMYLCLAINCTEKIKAKEDKAIIVTEHVPLV
jgi:hypothetical protein